MKLTHCVFFPNRQGNWFGILTTAFVALTLTFTLNLPSADASAIRRNVAIETPPWLSNEIVFSESQASILQDFLTDQTRYTASTLNTPFNEDSTLIINEVDADTLGTDTAEFVELYDGGAGNTPLDGLVVVFFNGNGNVSYEAFDLDGFSTNADGFFVLGNSGVPNADLVFPGNDLQNGADAVALYQGNAADFPNGTPVTMTNRVDAIVYDTSDSDDTGLLAALGLTAQFNENANGNKDGESNSRVPDERGNFVAQAPTPGTANRSDDGSNGQGITLISAIQGSGNTSSRVGDQVTVEAIAVGDFQNGDADTQRNLAGFLIQEEDSDADEDAATSEGIFIFEEGDFLTEINVGDLVQVTGTVSEAFGQTQIEATEIEAISSGNPLPTAATVNCSSQQ